MPASSLEVFQEGLNERLHLKDRWITDRFEDFGKRLADQNDALYRFITSQLLAVQHGADQQFATLTAREDSHYQEVRNLLNLAQERQDKVNTALIEAHRELHTIEKNGMEEFKISTQQRLEAIMKSLDVLREERAFFVLRDSHDTQVDSLEKNIDALERSTTEKLDIAIKTAQATLDARILTNADRITKMEQNLQVMNARNQQSIIALGILLTLVEIIIRFYG